MDIINRRYNTIPLEKKYNEYIGKYNNFLIIHKLDPSDKQNENYFENNKNNIIFLIEKFNAVLDNLNIEISKKEFYLKFYNDYLNDLKISNNKYKKKINDLKNSNAGAVAMYNDMKHMYNYTLIEYILIIVGIIIVIYDFK
jgi:hypothetical protein